MTRIRPMLRLCLLLLPAAVLCNLSNAQVTKALGKVKEIKFAGLHRYREADILTATGFAVGQTIVEDDLRGAAKHLGSTGAFTDVAYSYTTLAGAVKVQFELVEADKLLAVRFENFVWWSDAELRAKLRERVPLFKDELPIAGTLPDSVADALQALVSEREIPGNVQYSPHLENGVIESLLYRIEDAAIRVGSVDFPGAAPEELSELRAAARKELVGKNYSAIQVSSIAEHDFHDAYIRHGYLQAKFGTPSATLSTTASAGDPAAEPDKAAADSEAKPVSVAVALPVEPGLQFQLKTVEWDGNKAFPSAALQKVITVQIGQPANLLQLKKDLEQMKKLYGTRGYMKIEYKLEPHLDLATKTAEFTVQIREGDVYHFGDLTIEGVDSKTAARIRDAWSIREGEPFNTGYEESFLRESQKSLPPDRWTIAVEEHVNESDRSVDLTLRYVPPPTP